MTLDTARKVIDEKLREGTPLLSAIQSIWGQVTPEEAKQLLQEFDNRGTVTVPTEIVPTVAEQRPMPVLQIDWGMNLKPGTHLTPIFTILGLNTQIKPLVSFPLDHRIQCEDWNPTPALWRTDLGWQFEQRLRLNEPGDYGLIVSLIDPTPGQTEPVCYLCRFHVNVPVSDSGQLEKSLKITADDMTADLSNVLKNFHHVELDLKGAVLNAHESSLADRISQMFPQVQPGKQQPGAQQDDAQHVTSFLFSPDEELAAKIPYVNTRKPEMSLTRVTLHIANRPAIRLICGKTLTFGRNVPQEPCPDVPLAVEPELDHAISEEERDRFEKINNCFSRDHALLEVADQDVKMHDCRSLDGIAMTNGVIVDGTLLAKQGCVALFSCDVATNPTRKVLFCQMLDMQVSPYCETVELDSVRELPGELLLRWLYDDKLTQPRQFSAVKVTQSPAEQLKKYLDDKKCCTARIDTTETLLVVTNATLGGARDHVISTHGPVWSNVRLRILNLNETLYLENVDTPGIVAVLNDAETVLKPLRPIPIQPGLVIRKTDRDLFHFR